ncbi:MAG TPA: response regulator transcription factor [Polyangiaceae bacterium]|nr:response regulator transcription factor [Polyangiaceae bacterium]
MVPLVVLIEDNARLVASLERGLTEDGFEIRSASEGAAGLRLILDENPAAVILDLGLPDRDGMALLRDARERGLCAPVLVLTARDPVEARVEGLEAGADDYLVKPFAYPELLARLRALVRRSQRPWRPFGAFADLALAGDGQGVFVEGKLVLLSPRERALLELLMSKRGEILGRLQILQEVFGYDFDPGTNLIDVHVAHLRRKLGDSAGLVQTVRGSGYRLRPSDEQ